MGDSPNLVTLSPMMAARHKMALRDGFYGKKLAADSVSINALCAPSI
jgi:hypothetical protein